MAGIGADFGARVLEIQSHGSTTTKKMIPCGFCEATECQCPQLFRKGRQHCNFTFELNQGKDDSMRVNGNLGCKVDLTVYKSFLLLLRKMFNMP